MAAVVTETKVISIAGGPPGRIRVCGSVANTGVTTFVIQPGHSDTNVTNVAGVSSLGLRQIRAWGFSNTAAQKAPKIVKSYSTTNDADILTATCASGDDFDFWVEGDNAGA